MSSLVSSLVTVGVNTKKVRTSLIRTFLSSIFLGTLMKYSYSRLAPVFKKSSSLFFNVQIIRKNEKNITNKSKPRHGKIGHFNPNGSNWKLSIRHYLELNRTTITTQLQRPLCTTITTQFQLLSEKRHYVNLLRVDW